MGVFDYKTIAGQTVCSSSVSKGVERLVIGNTTIEECKEHVEYLIGLGFEKITHKSIPTDSENNYKYNLFYELKKDNQSVFVFFDCSLYTVIITSENKESITRTNDFQDNGESVVCTQHKIQSGMCYTIKLSDGRFICVDGGVSNQEDVDNLYNFLRENSLGQVNIALWIFTHSHVDHIALAKQFIEKYYSQVQIQAFAYNFPDCEKVIVAMENVKEMAKDIDDFSRTIERYYKDAKVHTLHTGQSIFYANVEIEVLYSLDNEFRKDFSNFNEFSLAFRIKTETGKTVTFLGDLMHDGCRQLFYTYGDYLKSDVLQVSHHGLIGGNKDLYKKIDPEICLWPTPEERFLGKVNERFHWCLGEGCCDYNSYLRDDKIKKRTHYHGGKTVSLTLK